MQCYSHYISHVFDMKKNINTRKFIDYRTTYAYRKGNRHMLPSNVHVYGGTKPLAALKHP